MNDDLAIMLYYVNNIKRILRNAMRRVAYHWKKHIDENFATEGGKVGGWKALKEPTKRKRRRLGFSEGPILQMRGKLAKGYKIHTHVLAGTNYSVEIDWEVKGMFGARDLADIHHHGAGHIPARKLFNEGELQRIFEEHVRRALGEIERLGG